MNEKLIELSKLFENNRGKYIYSNAELMVFFEVEHNEYKINIKLFKIDDIYRLFIFIELNESLIFKGLLCESNNELTSEFNKYVEILKKEDIESFIDKNYEIMKGCY